MRASGCTIRHGYVLYGIYTSIRNTSITVRYYIVYTYTWYIPRTSTSTNYTISAIVFSTVGWYDAHRTSLGYMYRYGIPVSPHLKRAAAEHARRAPPPRTSLFEALEFQWRSPSSIPRSTTTTISSTVTSSSRQAPARHPLGLLCARSARTNALTPSRQQPIASRLRCRSSAIGAIRHDDKVTRARPAFRLRRSMCPSRHPRAAC